MGIQRLRGHLEKYADHGFLGCEQPKCSNEKYTVIVDGPNLAYHISSKLSLASELATIYSHLKTGEAFAEFLNKLEHVNVTIGAIFFDGFLPPSKRATRLERLQNVLNGLLSIRAANPHGLAVSQIGDGSSDTSAEGLFCNTPQSGKTKNCMIPFLVSGVLDILRSSRYADRLMLVPGEADTYCADFARDHGGIVLTNDSDLPVHDLGYNGAVAFLDTIELSQCPSCRTQAVRAGVLYPTKLATRLSISDFKRFAFEIQQDYHITGPEAVRRAQSSYRTAKSIAFEAFCKTYESTKEESQAILKPPQHLDPRISEFVLQVILGHDLPFHSYLPQILEDSEEASAWDTSQDLRDFSYSLLLHNNDGRQNAAVWEYRRRHNRVSPRDVEIMSMDQCQLFAEDLHSQMNQLKQQEKTINVNTFWQILCLIRMCDWYTNRGHLSAFRATIELFLDVAGGQSVASWDMVHLYASVLATLASLRQLGQILSCLDIARMHPAIRQLLDQLRSLPILEFLMPDLRTFCDLIMSFKHMKHYLLVVESLEAAAELESQTQSLKGKASKKSRPKREQKRSKGKENSPASHKAAAGKASVDSSNIYAVLRELG